MTRHHHSPLLHLYPQSSALLFQAVAHTAAERVVSRYLLSESGRVGFLAFELFVSYALDQSRLTNKLQDIFGIQMIPSRSPSR